MKNKIKSYIIVLLLLISCEQNTIKKERDFWSKAIENSNIANNYQWIVVLPGVGCGGCIQVAEGFLKEHVKDTRIMFVITNPSSLKILQLKTGIKINEYSNVFLDTNKLFHLRSNNSIYPCVIKISNGKVTEHRFQKPGENAFVYLKYSLQ